MSAVTGVTVTDEQADIIAPMFELTAQGDHEAAAYLGELSQDPEAVRKAIAGDAKGTSA